MPSSSTKPAAEHPSLRGLRTVAAVAAAGSTAAASMALHVTQSTVVRAVAKFEQALEAPVFERHAGGMRVLAFGEGVLRRGREVLAHLRSADAGPWRTPLRGGRLTTQATTQQLKLVVALAKHGSQRSAAAVLGVTQSAVQQGLRQLEHLAGEPLFDRLAGGLRTTSRGAWVAQQAELALAQLRAIHEEAAAHRGHVQGLLAVGTLPYSTGPVVAAAIQDVTARWPGVQVTVVDGAYESLMAQLRRGEIDIVVGALRAEVESDLQQHRLFDDPLSILVRAHHPLLRKRRLDLAGVASADWVLPMPGSPAFSVLMRLFGEQQLPVPKGVSINSPTLLSAIVQRSDRLALMPVRQWQSELDAGLLCQLPLRLWNVHRTIGYTVRKAFSPTPVLSAFQAALSQGAQAG